MEKKYIVSTTKMATLSRDREPRIFKLFILFYRFKTINSWFFYLNDAP